jgi:xylose isomerase
MSYFEHLPAVRYEGPESDNPFAFRHYDRDKLVLGKRMEDHLRSPCVTGIRSYGPVSTCSGRERFTGRGSSPATL